MLGAVRWTAALLTWFVFFITITMQKGAIHNTLRTLIHYERTFEWERENKICSNKTDNRIKSEAQGMYEIP